MSETIYSTQWNWNKSIRDVTAWIKSTDGVSWFQHSSFYTKSLRQLTKSITNFWNDWIEILHNHEGRMDIIIVQFTRPSLQPSSSGKGPLRSRFECFISSPCPVVWKQKKTNFFHVEKVALKMAALEWVNVGLSLKGSSIQVLCCHLDGCATWANESLHRLLMSGCTLDPDYSKRCVLLMCLCETRVALAAVL